MRTPASASRSASATRSLRTPKPELEAGDGQLFLARKIIGDARGAQADQFGDRGKPHALEAMTVKNGDGGSNDIRTPTLEPVRPMRRGGVPIGSIARFDLGLRVKHPGTMPLAAHRCEAG